MNQKATYEITIAQKLEQLSRPDLQDSIWNRIKEQLDTDMPDDDGGLDAPQSPTAPDWHKLLRKTRPLLVVVAVVVSLLMLSKKRSRPAATNTENPAVIQQETASEAISDKGPPETQKTIPLPVPGNNTNDQKPLAGDPHADSGTTVLQVTPASPAIILVDSANNNTVNALPTQPPVVPPKKNRGVPGISDGDYRLVPTIDSIGRKKND